MNPETKYELEGTFGPLDNMELTLNRPGVATMTVAGLYAFGRIAPKDARSKDLRAFPIRHSDDDDSEPATLERSVTVNHYGTFLVDSRTADAIDSLLDGPAAFGMDKECLYVDDWNFC